MPLVGYTKYIIRASYVTKVLVVEEPTNATSHVLSDKRGIGLVPSPSADDDGIGHETRGQTSSLPTKISVVGKEPSIQPVKLTHYDKLPENARRQQRRSTRRSERDY